MKKIFILLTTLLFMTSCQLKSDKSLTKIIETKIKDNPTKIDLTLIDKLDYDKLLILEPYTNIEKTQSELNVDLSNINGNQIHLSDGINLIVFLKNNKSIKISELNRKNGDFEDYKIFINRENALFEKDKNGIITLAK